jgi:hypothetical protein
MKTLHWPYSMPSRASRSVSVCAWLLSLLLLCCDDQDNYLCAQQPVFSGPQVGEKLPPLPVKGLTGQVAGEPFDVLERVGKQPTLLIFFHDLTRPAFGMTRALAKFAESKSQAGLKTVVVFLTDDPTQTEKWAEILPKQMPATPVYGYSVDGQEGPGAYGLNRNVILTILVANEGVVTFNAALIQPQLQADGPSVLKAIVDVTGGGPVPGIEQLADARMAMDPARSAEPSQEAALVEMRELLRAVINRQATEDEVRKAAIAVDEFVAKHPAAKTELARIANTIANSDKLGNYGTAAAQEVIRQWAKSLPAPSAPLPKP